jgi:hypothetical protein
MLERENLLCFLYLYGGNILLVSLTLLTSLLLPLPLTVEVCGFVVRGASLVCLLWAISRVL